MSENVFNAVQIGSQGGTFTAPGSAATATFLFPVESPVPIELDRASQFPKQDVGRNARNRAGSGFHGVRGATATLAAQLRFEDVMDILDMHAAGGITPTGGGPYTWAYPFEAGTPTLVPRTIESGNVDASQAQMRLISALVTSLTVGFPAITAPGASPWTLSADLLGVDRDINPLTASLSARAGLEVVQGHLTRLYEGTTGTAFASLTELAASLKSYTQTSSRNLALRAYGSASDVASKFGFTDQSTTTFEATVAVSSTAKSDFHDIWNAAAPASLGERRWRIKAIGTGSKVFLIDARVGILAVPIDEADGERLFKVTGELVDDATLGAPWQASITNSIASLA
jgi:hypothetical protein